MDSTLFKFQICSNGWKYLKSLSSVAVQFGPKSMARDSKIFFVRQVNVNLAKGNEYSHVARRVLLVYHPQLHGQWLSTEKRTKTKEFMAEIFHRNFPVWFWWSSHKSLMENFKGLFQVLCPRGSEVSFVSSLTPSFLGCFRNLWFRSFTPFFTLFGWEVLDLNCWRNSGKGEFFDQNFR